MRSWSARRDLNPRHLGSKPSALSPELRADILRMYSSIAAVGYVGQEEELCIKGVSDADQEYRVWHRQVG